jgi:glycosyltransferase involved in cell wall biosynthesis
MGCGAAVLCNDLPVFRETCGDAAEYADATNAACVADAIESLWDDEPRRRELIRRGRERYARFRWTDVADAVLAALTDAARGRA